MPHLGLPLCGSLFSRLSLITFPCSVALNAALWFASWVLAIQRGALCNLPSHTENCTNGKPTQCCSLLASAYSPVTCASFLAPCAFRKCFKNILCRFILVICRRVGLIGALSPLLKAEPDLGLNKITWGQTTPRAPKRVPCFKYYLLSSRPCHGTWCKVILDVSFIRHHCGGFKNVPSNSLLFILSSGVA